MTDRDDAGSSEPTAVDFVVHGLIITMDAGRRMISHGAVAVDAGRIVAVSDRNDITTKYRPRRVVDRPNQIVLPGFSDCHTHSTQALARGLIAGELPMIYRLYIPADMDLTPEEAGLGAKLCAAQLALSGVATMCDFAGDTSPEHEEAIVAGVAEVGLRHMLLRGRGDQSFHHAELYSQIRDRSWRRVREGEAERDLIRTESLIARARSDGSGLFHAGVCASSLLGYSPEYFAAAHGLAKRHDVTLQVHSARDREEVEFCLSVFGKRPIERLIELGVVDERLVCVHAILATAPEIRALGEVGAGVAHSAVETINILNGIPSVQRMRVAGVNVGLGCDNAVNDMFTVMHTAWALQVGMFGTQNYEPDCLAEDDILAMATIDAAKMLRLDRLTGSIEPGKSADLIILDGDAAHMMPLQAAPSDLVRFASRANVRHVLVAGRFVVEDFRNATLDLEALAAKVRPIARRLGDVVSARRYKPLRGCCG